MRISQLLLAIFLLVLFNAQAQAQTLPTDGLVGYFPSNSNSKAQVQNAAQNFTISFTASGW
jgi:hypothetical protein